MKTRLGVIVASLAIVPLAALGTPSRAAASDEPVQVVAAGDHSCALFISGAVKCWGSDRYGESTVPSDLGNVTAIGAGAASTCALVANNMRCWGRWAEGDNAPTEPPMSIKSFSMWGADVCVLTLDGGAQCWGGNYMGQDTVPAGLPKLSTLATGNARTCAVTVTDSMWCWGNTRFFNMGGASLPSLTKMQVGSYLCFIGTPTRKDYFSCIGEDPFSTLTQINSMGDALDFSITGANVCAVSLANNLICGGDSPDIKRPPADLGLVASVSVGERHACAITLTKEVRCWGANDYGQTEVPRSLMLPNAPPSLSVLTKNSTAVRVGWQVPVDKGKAESYALEYSLDNGRRWVSAQTPASDAPAYTIRNLQPASALRIRVAAVNALGTGPWSPVIDARTDGSRAMTLTFRDSRDSALTGGSATWRMADGSAWSSHAFGLTQDGAVNVAAAPAGLAQVSLVGATTQEGVRVDGQLPVVMGSEASIYMLPDAGVCTFTISVGLPNGVAVSGAQVELTGVSTENKTAGLKFAVPASSMQAITNDYGLASLVGICAPGSTPRAKVLYNDGEITQTKTTGLASSEQTVYLDYTPWIDAPSQVTAPAAGKPVNVDIEALEQEIPSLRARTPGQSRAGVTVSITPPKGVKLSTCKATATATTNANGHARLTFCPTTSGAYRLIARGAAGSRSVQVRVPKSTLAVAALAATSTKPGTVRVTWTPPAYTGGEKVIGYAVTLAAGKSRVSQDVAAKSRNLVVSKLKNATKYSVLVVVKTKSSSADSGTVVSVS